MKYIIYDKQYEVIIIKKNNKNTYIRVNEKLDIVVTTNKLSSNKYIMKLLDNNRSSIKKMIDKQEKDKIKKESFFYLGKYYDIIEVSIMDDIEIDKDKIYIPNRKVFDIWFKKQISNLFMERLLYNYNKFTEIKECPTLKIRSMKTRWGVYNRAKYSITLNSKLIEYDINKIDYVIIHELSHVVHFNHSNDFWNLVNKYCPNYKKIRKELKE